jgi:hypothetical protein
MGASGDDEPAAYRSSPAYQPQYTVFLFIDQTVPADSKASPIMAAVPRGLNFGLKAAVLQYCRKPALVSTILRRFLMVAVFTYVDDYTVPEPDFARGSAHPSITFGPKRYPGSGQAMVWDVYDIMGFRSPAIAKSEAWGEVADFIGVTTDFRQIRSHGLVLMSIKASTRDKALAAVIRAIDTKSLSPAAAATLYGKLRWVFCLGRVGTAALNAFKRRQYESRPPSRPTGLDEDESWPIDIQNEDGLDLKSALLFIRRLLEGPCCPALLRCADSGEFPVLIWSDASWDAVSGGRIGYVVRFPKVGDDPAEVIYSEADAPAELVERLYRLRVQKTFIHPLELLGIVAPYFAPQLADRLRGRDVLHFGDNNGMNMAAIKGYSKCPDMALILHSFELRLAELSLRTWIEWVPSKANIADAPSRTDPEARALVRLLVEAYGASSIPFTMPAVPDWADF